MNNAARLFSLLLLLPPFLSVSAQPKLEIEGGTKFDLGNIYRGTVVEKKLTLKNTGSGTLIVDKVEVSCGCTGTVVSNDHIPPGQTGTLLITFNSKNFSGNVRKTLTVSTNVPEAASTLIEFTAKITDEIIANPQQLWFKDAEVGKTSASTLTIRNDGKEDLELTGSRTQLAGLVVKLPSGAIKPGKEGKVVAEFTPKGPVPIIADGIFVKTSNIRQPEVFIPVYGNAKEVKSE